MIVACRITYRRYKIEFVYSLFDEKGKICVRDQGSNPGNWTIYEPILNVIGVFIWVRYLTNKEEK